MYRKKGEHIKYKSEVKKERFMDAQTLKVRKDVLLRNDMRIVKRDSYLSYRKTDSKKRFSRRKRDMRD